MTKSTELRGLEVRNLGPMELRRQTLHMSLPLVIEPVAPHRNDFTELLHQNRTALRSLLTQCGAILFRQTAYARPEGLADANVALGLNMLAYPYFTDNYREKHGNGVVNASSTKSDLPVPPHTEQAFNRFRPGVVSFLCLQPANLGGETPIHDCISALDELPGALKDKLDKSAFCKTTSGMSKKALEANFGTDNRGAIEEICGSFGVTSTWNGDALSIVTKGPCTVRHPVTLETALSCFWTIASLHYFFRNYSSWPGASAHLGAICRILPVSAFDLLARNFHPFFRTDYRYHFEFRDRRSSGISLKEQALINAAVWKHTTIFVWQAGDLLVLDNMKTGHSRMPYLGARRHVTSVSEYYDAFAPKYSVNSNPGTAQIS